MRFILTLSFEWKIWYGTWSTTRRWFLCRYIPFFKCIAGSCLSIKWCFTWYIFWYYIYTLSCFHICMFDKITTRCWLSCKWYIWWYTWLWWWWTCMLYLIQVMFNKRISCGSLSIKWCFTWYIFWKARGVPCSPKCTPWAMVVTLTYLKPPSIGTVRRRTLSHSTPAQQRLKEHRGTLQGH